MMIYSLNRVLHLPQFSNPKLKLKLPFSSSSSSFFPSLLLPPHPNPHPHGPHVIEIHKDQVGVSSNTNSNSFARFRTFCTTQDLDLSTKKCVPCNTKDLRPMTEDAAHSLIPQVAEWNLVNEGGTLKLRRSWKVKTFAKGLQFFSVVADLAEAEGHHPDLHLVGWNNVTIEIWTHAVGGLTENDFILAAKIDRLNVHGLLGRKVSD